MSLGRTLTRRRRHGNAELRKNRVRFQAEPPGSVPGRRPRIRTSRRRSRPLLGDTTSVSSWRPCGAGASEGAGLTVMLAADWIKSRVVLVLLSPLPTRGASVLVLVGGEGGGRRQRQWAGLRTNAPYRWGVPGRLGHTEDEKTRMRSRNTGTSGGSKLITIYQQG